MSIALLEKIILGGSEQWITARSHDISNPVILFLHGGPGTSQLTLMRNNTKKLEEHFIVVNWDQRGAGKSYSAIKDTSKMNIAQFVADTLELSEYLARRFGKQRLLLCGHSWGSVIGILAVKQKPELFHAYIGIGQVAHMAENERISYEWTLQQAQLYKDKKSLLKLAEIGPPPYSGDWRSKFIAQRRILARFGGEVYGNAHGAFGIVIRNVLFSAEYNLPDRINVFRGIFGSLDLLFAELLTINLFEQTPELKVPVFFMLGRHDYEAPFAIAEKYFDVLKAPRKELIWFENSAHMPHIEEKDKFSEVLINKIVPTASMV